MDKPERIIRVIRAWGASDITNAQLAHKAGVQERMVNNLRFGNTAMLNLQGLEKIERALGL